MTKSFAAIAAIAFAGLLAHAAPAAACYVEIDEAPPLVDMNAAPDDQVLAFDSQSQTGPEIVEADERRTDVRGPAVDAQFFVGEWVTETANPQFQSREQTRFMPDGRFSTSAQLSVQGQTQQFTATGTWSATPGDGGFMIRARFDRPMFPGAPSEITQRIEIIDQNTTYDPASGSYSHRMR